MKGPSKWLALFALFTLGALALAWTLWGAFTSKDYEKLSAAYQAFFAYTGIFPAVAALLVAFQSERRASEAETRASTSEAEANQVRQAALLQAKATYELAQATREQALVMQAQEERNTTPTLALVHTGGLGADSTFSLVNLSPQTMFIQEAILHFPGGGQRRILVGKKAGSQDDASTAVISAGGEKEVVIANYHHHEEDTGVPHLKQITRKTSFLEVAVSIKFLHAPTGSRIIQKHFKLIYADTHNYAAPVIEELPDLPW